MLLIASAFAISVLFCFQLAWALFLVISWQGTRWLTSPLYKSAKLFVCIPFFLQYKNKYFPSSCLLFSSLWPRYSRVALSRGSSKRTERGKIFLESFLSVSLPHCSISFHDLGWTECKITGTKWTAVKKFLITTQWEQQQGILPGLVVFFLRLYFNIKSSVIPYRSSTRIFDCLRSKFTFAEERSAFMNTKYPSLSCYKDF